MIALALVASLLTSPVLDEGQGPVEPNAVLAELSPGTHWFGAPFDAKKGLGKVTIVSYWGS